MSALATLGKSGLLTKACTGEKKEILDTQVSLKEEVNINGRTGVKGKLRAVCDFVCAFSCRKTLCFLLTQCG